MLGLLLIAVSRFSRPEVEQTYARQLTALVHSPVHAAPTACIPVSHTYNKRS